MRVVSDTRLCAIVQAYCNVLPIISVLCVQSFQGAEELDVGGRSRRRAMEVAQMKEQLESQVRRHHCHFSRDALGVV